MNPIYMKIYEAVTLCLDLSKSPLAYRDDGERVLTISPDYFFEYISNHCLENIKSMMRVYDKNDRLYKNKEIFLEDFIANILDDNERKMFNDFMWKGEKLKGTLNQLKRGDHYPYITNIVGFKLEVMQYDIRDRLQAIASIKGSRLAAAVNIKEDVIPLDPTTFEIIYIDLSLLKKEGNSERSEEE